MEEFVVVNLENEKEKQIAETLLKDLGYSSDEGWNNVNRGCEDFTFIGVYKRGNYGFHNHDCDPFKHVTLKELVLKALNNKVIGLINSQHGQKVKEYYTKRGLHLLTNLSAWSFDSTKENGGPHWYYGIVDGKFNSYDDSQVKNRSVEVFSIDSFSLPREGFKKLYEAACTDWKSKLSEKYPSLIYEDKCYVLKEDYIGMRKACNSAQMKVLDEVFGKDPFETQEYFMCTETLEDAFTKGKQYVLEGRDESGYWLLDDKGSKHLVRFNSLKNWADHFYKV